MSPFNSLTVGNLSSTLFLVCQTAILAAATAGEIFNSPAITMTSGCLRLIHAIL